MNYLTFNEFINENEFFKVLSNDKKFVFKDYHKKALYEAISQHCNLTLQESILLNKIINENEDIFEGIFSNIMDKAKEILAKVTDTLKEAGKEFLDGIVGDAKKLMGGHGKKAVIEKVTTMGTSTAESLKDEIVAIKDTFGYYVKFFTGGILKFAQEAFSQAFKGIKKEESVFYDDLAVYAVLETIKNGNYTLEQLDKELTETLAYLENHKLYESDDHHGVNIPFLSTIKTFLQKAPIFKHLGQLEAKATKIAENVLHAGSMFCKELGGPGTYEFAVLAVLVGAVTEITIKTGIKSAISFIFPPLTPILATVKAIALGITIVAVVEHILKDGSHGHAHH